MVLKLPSTPQQHARLVGILKQNPGIMKQFMKQRQIMRQRQQQQQQQQQEQQQQHMQQGMQLQESKFVHFYDFIIVPCLQLFIKRRGSTCHRSAQNHLRSDQLVIAAYMFIYIYI